MPNNRIPVIQRVARSVRQGAMIDVYALVDEIRHEFPGVSRAELERIVSEEVVIAHANAVWEHRET